MDGTAGTRVGARRRVLFVSHSAECIGPNVSLLELVTRMPAWVEPIVAVPKDGWLCSELGRRGVRDCRVVRLDKYGIPGLALTMRRDGIALAYGNSASGVSKNALIACKLSGRPFIYHLRETARTGQWRKLRFPRYADAVIAVSQATARTYDHSLDSPVIVVPNGVPLDRFDKDREECRRRLRSELGLPPDSVVILNVGNVYARKGQQLAVEVMQDVTRSSPRSFLILVGRLDRDPAYVGGLRASIAERRLGERILITGFRDDVAEMLCGADILLHTASDDPHPRVVIEAMASRLPVVAFSVGGVPETVMEGLTGFLIRPFRQHDMAEALLRLIGDGNLRGRMGEAGWLRACESYSSETTARQIADVIGTVLAGGRN